MGIESIHSFLVHPRKKSTGQSSIVGTNVPLAGKLFDLLNDIYSSTDSQCDIEISFNQSVDGKQANPCRELIIDYLATPNLARAKKIAERLEGVTTKRSGLGLLFVIAGKEGAERKFVISRFPTDSAILAEEVQNKLSVEFLERVFMKSATSYKAAAYQDSSLKTGFWVGRAVDKQINDRVIQVSNYWIADFLASDFLLTSAAGTRNFALAIRNALRKTTDLTIKHEIAAAVTLAKALKGKTADIVGFENMMNLSRKTKEAINSEIKDGLADQFKFDLSEFSQHLAYRSVELDNGGMLTAEVGKFDDVFQQQAVQPVGEIRFSTQGRVVGERLGKSKIDRLARKL